MRRRVSDTISANGRDLVTPSPRFVTSTDNVRIAVYETGSDSAPTIVAIHGYPDNHSVWNGVAAELADNYRVVTYDVRGAGASDTPRKRRAYRMPQLVDDLRAVLDEVSPSEPVHLLAHDWGSIQAWPAVSDERLAGRIATFTSISGPSLDYSGAWLSAVRTHPLASLRQLAHSYYIVLFQVPGLPEAAARAGLVRRGVRRAGGPAPADSDAVNGIQLYRANMLHRTLAPKPTPTRIPVQVIVPESDPFATPQLAVEAPRRWAEDLTVNRIAGGHWVVSRNPEVIARLTREFIESRGSAAPTRVATGRETT